MPAQPAETEKTATFSSGKMTRYGFMDLHVSLYQNVKYTLSYLNELYFEGVRGQVVGQRGREQGKEGPVQPEGVH